MKPPADMDSAPAILIIRNALWAFPYLAVMGLIWGYLADASSGAIAGLLIAAATSVWVGKATTTVLADEKLGSFLRDVTPCLIAGAKSRNCDQ